jgi:FkbM family methyltransferase
MSHAIVKELERILNEPVSSVIERERHALDRLLEDSGRKVVLFGAGGLGKQTLACLRSVGVEPLAISDNNPGRWGTRLDGAAVVPPGTAAEAFGAEALFIVTIWNPYHWYSETHRQLAYLGCRRIASPSPVYWRFAETFLPFYAQDLPHTMSDHIADILRAGGLWHDDRSQQEYLRQVRWRFLGETDFPRNDGETSYFPEDLLRLQADEVFVDCGAYDGDTIRAMISRCRDAFQHILAIEPDAQTFSALRAYVDTLPDELRQKIRIVRCAVGSTTVSESFEDIGVLDDRISVRGNTIAPCISVSELLDGSQRATYIKMDVEGSEYDGVQGARTVIERDRPVLAICVYHRPGDLWRLPLLMREMVSDYRMYLRSYEGDGWQTVAYAIPNERVS